jgi:carotenoid cleavage dioxygenase-like enzyme
MVDWASADHRCSNVFFWWPSDDEPVGTHTQRNQLESPTVRWVFDPKSPTDSRVKPAEILPLNGEFSRIDDRFVTKEYSHFWQTGVDVSRFYDAERCGPSVGGLFNILCHYTWDGKTRDVYWAGPTTTFQEPALIPKDGGAEGEGYLIALANRLDVLRNDIMIFDAMNLTAGPIATIHLPFKLRLGVHGNFVEHRDIIQWQERRSEAGDVGPLKPAAEPLPWQKMQRAGL